MKFLKFFNVMMATVVILLMMSACGSAEDKLAGNWYNTMDPEEELILTEDGSYSFHNEGGTYSVDVEGERLILDSGYDTEIFVIDSSGDAIIDEYGETFYNNRENAVAAYEDYCEAKTSEERQQIVGEWERETWGYVRLERIIINDDNTYTYIRYSSDSTDVDEYEKGTWDVETRGDKFTIVIFTVSETNMTEFFTDDIKDVGDEYEYRIDYDEDKENYVFAVGCDFEKVK